MATPLSAPTLQAASDDTINNEAKPRKKPDEPGTQEQWDVIHAYVQTIPQTLRIPGDFANISLRGLDDDEICMLVQMLRAMTELAPRGADKMLKFSSMARRDGVRVGLTARSANAKAINPTTNAEVSEYLGPERLNPLPDRVHERLGNIEAILLILQLLNPHQGFMRASYASAIYPADSKESGSTTWVAHPASLQVTATSGAVIDQETDGVKDYYFDKEALVKHSWVGSLRHVYRVVRNLIMPIVSSRYLRLSRMDILGGTYDKVSRKPRSNTMILCTLWLIHGADVLNKAS